MVAITSLPPSQHPTTASATATSDPATTREAKSISETMSTLELVPTPKPKTLSKATKTREVIIKTELTTTPEPMFHSESTSVILATRSATSVLSRFDVPIMDNLAQQALLPDVKVRNARQIAQEWPVTMVIPSPSVRRARGPPRSHLTTPTATLPLGLTVLTVDGSAHEAPLPEVQVRIIRLSVQGGSVAIAESSTNANGTMWVDISEAGPVIVVASKYGYLDTSSTYHSKPGDGNIHQIAMHKHSLRREITWMSGLDRLVEFRPRNQGIPYSFEIPAGSLDVPEQCNIEFKFQDINTSDPAELRQAPEIIGAVESSEGTTLISLAVFSMAELTVIDTDRDELVDLLLPFEAEFPLSRKPRGTRQGSRIPAWYFDKMSGVWRRGGVGKVRLNRFGEPMWRFEARHFTWWSAMQPWAGTSCIIIKTCYDKKCKQIASFTPVEVDGVDFSYSSSTVTNGEGRSCAQFKMGGHVRVSSPDAWEPQDVEGNPVSSSSCPPEYDTLVLRPPGQAHTGQCEEVVIIVKDPSATTGPSFISKPAVTPQPIRTTTLEPVTSTPPFTMTTPTTPPPTPPPIGLTVVTMDDSAQQALLPDVQIRIIRPRIEDQSLTTTNPTTANFSMANFTTANPLVANFSMANFSTANSSIANVSTENSPITASTTADGLALLDIPEDEPIIVVASKEGYLDTSFSYRFQPGVKNVLPMLVHKHSLREQLIWRSEEEHQIEFRRPDQEIPYIFDIPAGSLNITEGSRFEVRFFGVQTSTPAEIKEVPELIGALESSDGIKLIGLESFSMAEVTVENTETNDPVDVVTPFEAVFPLDRKPRGTRHGSRIPAWYFDKTTGIWRENGVGKVKRNKGGELVWSFQASHFTWWSATQPWPETSCIVIKTCYDKSCKQVASFVPVELHGVDFSYSSSGLITDVQGWTCAHFKMGGQIRISSPCSKKPKFRTGNIGDTTYCPEDTQVLRPQDHTETGRCEQVVIVVREGWSLPCSEPDIHTKTNSTHIGVGSTSFFQCTDGYNLVGQSQRACLPCGKWSGPEEICTL